MDFHWIGFFFWLFVAASFLALIVGLIKLSSRLLVLSGLLMILPFLYFLGAENWMRWLVLFPLLPFALAIFAKKKD
ncbi:hypothetical protein D1B31_00985 [Neobacillus notoginsengisoli]|uniref:Uncharacterized protein n=1 Tax=Neobacillus notoginsengisoli TaxID=1578198 RepID=A0A417Z009_9BACI|nr:hypothetical protein [Neobacillus notoginsengisoli]RHW43278.1 hypothetical protein D1B31_00985 [Neobacillus notoginsengisoli]